MLNLPFDKPGSFWRGNLHTHSTNSDGQLPPEKVCQRYREAGYDFLALTDHFLERYHWPMSDTRAFRDKNFTTIIGAELHADRIELGDMWHILAVGLPLDFAPPAPDESAASLAGRAMAAGAYVAAAHPNWYALSEVDLANLGMVDAIEVFNGTAVDHNDHSDSWHIADIMLGRGKRYLVCATDDFHAKPERHDFALGWVMVKSESLAPESLLAALKAGHYYSTTGPEIYDIQVRPGDSLTVRCSPASRVFVTGKTSRADAGSGYTNTEYTFNIKKFLGSYCRVTVRDQYGRRAWSNPIWLEG